MPLWASWDAAQMLRDWRRAREHKSTAFLLCILSKLALADRTRHALLLGLFLDDDGRDALRSHGEARDDNVGSIYAQLDALTASELGGGGGISIQLERDDGAAGREVVARLFGYALDLRAICEGLEGKGFASTHDSPYNGTSRTVQLTWEPGGRGLKFMCPVDFRKSEIQQEFAAGGARAVEERFGKKGMPLVGIHAERMFHGWLHAGGTGTSGVVKALGALYLSISPQVHRDWTKHVAARWGRPFEQNIYTDKTTHPRTKLGDFVDLGSVDADALKGFVPQGDRSGGLITRVVDNLVKTHRQHTEFVYSGGARGKALERVCEVCRKKVHLGWDDRYYIGVGGARPEVHEFCLRPKPSAG